MLLVNQGAIESLAQFLTALLIFVFVLVITWWTTRFIANYQKQSMTGTNIEVVETTKIAPNKYLQIIRAGDQYILIAVCKDSVTKLAKLSEQELMLANTDSRNAIEFGDILKKASKKIAGKSTTSDQSKEQADTDEK